jgi:[glutamine synthetase] adenylyltransferase / [glutamine synthetase]-adenylyl-L-tyrosine phosphorylase
MNPPQAAALAIDLACRVVAADSAFARRAAVAAVGSTEAAQLRWLGELAREPWTEARIEAEIQSVLGTERGTDGGPGPAAFDARSPEQLAAQLSRWSRALRIARTRIVVGTLVRDVAGVAPLAEVVGTMSALARIAVGHALGVAAPLLAARHGVPCAPDGTPQDLLVVAMGKGGGGELNVSSDLDLVFVYDRDGETKGAAAARPISNQEFFERLGRALIGVLADATADGFVFRIDMRLRPDGDSGPLAASQAMLEAYLVGHGRAWERFAWLKADVISTPVFATPAQFEQQRRALGDLVRPFVYRKYLDFNAIAALRELHAKIRAERSRRRAGRAPVDDVKLGRGGIREIEFIAQTFQVVRGGREPRLRTRSTLVALEALVACRALEASVAGELAAAYVLLRQVEHALQYVDDAQTHLMPADPAGRDRVARLLRRQDGATLMAELDAARERVAAAFDAVFAPGEAPAPASAGTLPDDWLAVTPEATAARLGDLGYLRPAEGAARLAALGRSRAVATASEPARRAIERLVGHFCVAIPRILPQAIAGTDFDHVLARAASLVEVIAGRSTYVALLNEFPVARARVLRVLAASPWATEYLVRHPILLDELLEVHQFGDEPDWAQWRAGLRAALDDAHPDAERQMNLLRDEHHAQLFRLLVADLEGRLTLERLADHLSALADATLEETLSHVWRGLPRRHRETPRFAVVAYGKLGGKELGYASDLDLIFVYDDDHPDAAEAYGQLARRMINWLTTHTSSGILFDIDLRLRPNGNAGLLVTSVEAFDLYQRPGTSAGPAIGGAWVWEHQALTRARACAGDRAVGERVESIRRAVLAEARDPAWLAGQVVAMRARMLAGHPNRSHRFDLKHDRGGMVDVEFAVQYLVLAHAGHEPRLLDNLGNLALLQIASGRGLIDEHLAAAAADAYRDYRLRQHALRLNGNPTALAEPGAVAARIDDVLALWRAVLGTDEPRAGDAGAALARSAP